MVCSPGVTPLGILILPSASTVAPVPPSLVIVTTTLSLVAGLPLIVSLPSISTVPHVRGIVGVPSGFTTIVEGTITLTVAV